MATIKSGVDGKVTIPDTLSGGQTGLITEWAINPTREIHRTTNFDDTGNWHRKLGGMADLTGTCTAWWDAATANKLKGINTEDQSPSAGFKLSVSQATQIGYSFAGIISGIQVTTNKTAGPIPVILTFEGSGTPAEA